MKKNVVLSVVSHGQSELVQRLLASIDEFLICNHLNVTVVVTENLKDSIEVFSSRFPVEVRVNLRPKGFGDNHNSTFTFYDSDYFFIVNPDIVLFQSVNLADVLEHLVDSGVNLASPAIFNQSGDLEDYRRSDLTISNLIMRRFSKNFDREFVWFAGMFLIVDSKSFRGLNGFDTRYYMYVEDCDLCMRARKLGLNLGDAVGFSVIHEARRSSRKNWRYFRWHVTSLTRFFFNRYFS